MKTIRGKINLLKFKNACVVSVGEAQTKGIFIPIDDNLIYVSADNKGKTKNAYVNFVAFKNPDSFKFGYTHDIRLSVPNGKRSLMSEEERKAIPYLGNMNMDNNAPNFGGNKTAAKKPSFTPVVGGEIDDEDNLPF